MMAIKATPPISPPTSPSATNHHSGISLSMPALITISNALADPPYHPAECSDNDAFYQTDRTRRSNATDQSGHRAAGGADQDQVV